jgi:NADH:ubiquinone oxidoreductase subunit 4 (subunit M)
VEAPVIGSMFLAAVLLKLRAYGVYRVILIISSFIRLSFNVFSIFLIYGGLLRSLVCVFQSDIKSLIAYSSISHMGGLMCGLISQVELAMFGT